MSNKRKLKEAEPDFEFTVTKELIEEAAANGWTGAELLATAIQRSAAAQGKAVLNVEVHANGKVGRVRAAPETISAEDEGQ